MADGRSEGVQRPAEAFEKERGRLLRLAYRMLGSIAEAEDVLQDAWLRWSAAPDPVTPGFLPRVVARLCIDHLRSARVRRETYPGTWLPEPWVEQTPADGAGPDAGVALLLAMERLSPLERAAFVLHDLFDWSFEEIAATLDRTDAACRQLAARARRNVRSAGPRFTVDPERARALAEAFATASRSGDTEALGRLLREDARLVSDGGGRRAAAVRTLAGRGVVLRFFAGLARRLGGGPVFLHMGPINGAPGFVTLDADGGTSATVLELDGDAITAIYVMRNPEKLRHLGGLREAGRPAAGPAARTLEMGADRG